MAANIMASNIDPEPLLQTAIDFAKRRLPTGEAVTAAVMTDQGSIFTGIWNDASVDAATLCAETGPICQAHAAGEAVFASVCVARDFAEQPFRVLPACGICQERLAFWGLEVLIGVPGKAVADICEFKTLRALRPCYWNDEMK